MPTIQIVLGFTGAWSSSSATSVKKGCWYEKRLREKPHKFFFLCILRVVGKG